jgi:hypothetical protein
MTLYPLIGESIHINNFFPQRRRDAEKVFLCVPSASARDNAFEIYLFGSHQSFAYHLATIFIGFQLKKKYK